MKLSMQLFIITTALILMVLGLQTAWSDDDHEYRQRAVGVANVQFPIYTEECGGCHLAYPPGLLPSRSWQKIMSGLQDHFGDNAEMDPETKQRITEFLTENSADHSQFRRSKSMLRGMQTLREVPTRISKLPYFVHEHDEINKSMVQGNDKVRSFSNCNACHRRAAQGLFSENDINIPGYGRWDD